MKRLLLLLLTCSCAFAQHKNKVAERIGQLQKQNVVFENRAVFTNARPAPAEKYEATVRFATIADLNRTASANIASEALDYIALSIPYQGTVIKALLYKVDINTADFQVDTDKATNVSFEKGAHYRGIVAGDPNSLVSFNFFRNEMSGIISTNTFGNLVIGKLTTKGNLTDYIIYAERDLSMVSGFNCLTKDITEKPLAPSLTRTSPLTTRCVTMYFELDYDLYLANGGDVSQSVIWMNSLFNNVQTLYSNDNINIAMKSVYVWTTDDPYSGEFSWQYLQQFHELRPIFNGDVGQLLGIDSGLGGVAAVVDGLCSNSNYSYSDVYFDFETVPVYSWTVMVIAHELGHLFGSPHTHGCWWNDNGSAIDGCGPTANIAYAEGPCMIEDVPAPEVGGTIMSYCHLIGGVGINFANGFGPLPAARIANTIDSSPCLSTDCINTCISLVMDIAPVNLTTTSATITWTDLNPTTSWEVSFAAYPFEINTWTTVFTNSFDVSGLSPNTYYALYVRSLCDGDMPPTIRRGIFATPENDYCSGKQFLDSGGMTNSYTHSENWVRTITPLNPENKIQLTFTSVDIELDYDYLYIFNGPDASFPQMTEEPISGNAIVGPFVSTHESGALTFKFTSDQYVENTGWVADISCTNLGVGEHNLIDYSYYPNPASGIVTISSPNEITQVSVLSIDGKLLYQDSQKSATSKVDVSRFATGTYIFKVQFENGGATFKILKQ